MISSSLCFSFVSNYSLKDDKITSYSSILDSNLLFLIKKRFDYLSKISGISSKWTSYPSFYNALIIQESPLSLKLLEY